MYGGVSKIIRWMCGVSRKDRNTSEELRNPVVVEPITTFFFERKIYLKTSKNIYR